MMPDDGGNNGVTIRRGRLAIQFEEHGSVLGRASWRVRPSRRSAIRRVDTLSLLSIAWCAKAIKRWS
jgi:hypothetical protein